MAVVKEEAARVADGMQATVIIGRGVMVVEKANIGAWLSTGKLRWSSGCDCNWWTATTSGGWEAAVVVVIGWRAATMVIPSWKQRKRWWHGWE